MNMNSYIIRVELHGAVLEATYVQLHTAMEGAGFSRQITADGGKQFYLPTAMYTCSSWNDASMVRQAAVNAAATTGRSATVFVAKMDGWSATGLNTVNARG
jgi:hypothetical protein